MRPALALVLAGVCSAAPLSAQRLPSGAIGLGGSSTRLHSSTATDASVMSGVTVGGTAHVGRGRLSVEGAYHQGSLAADSGTTVPLDLVEGRLMLAMRPRGWLTALAGAHARAFVAPNGTERWLLWEARLRAEGPLVGATVQTHVELWAALGGTVNVGSGAPSARGGEVGLTLHLPRSPVWARLTYGIDQARQAGGGNTRTVEDLGVTIGIGR